MLYEKWDYEIKYEIDEFTNQLRKEITNKSELGINISKQLNQQKLSKESQKRIWKLILKKPRDCEFLILRFYNSKESFEILKESLNELNIECEKILNFFLDSEIIKKRAKIWSPKFNTHESFSEDKFVENMMNREKIRLKALKEISDSIQVININSDCSQDEIEVKIINEMKK
jgi:adenylate kinase family enzyme